LYPNIKFQRLLVCEPPMYGRLDAGVSCTAKIHQPADATIATPPRRSCQIRRPSFGGPANRYTSANAGNTINACSILARNANPTNEKASMSQRVLPCSSARASA
jgi:hypothetical protein